MACFLFRPASQRSTAGDRPHPRPRSRSRPRSRWRAVKRGPGGKARRRSGGGFPLGLLSMKGRVGGHGVLSCSLRNSHGVGTCKEVSGAGDCNPVVDLKTAPGTLRRMNLDGLYLGRLSALRTCLKNRFASRPRLRPSSSSSKFPAKPRTKDEGRGRARGNHTFFRHALRSAALDRVERIAARNFRP